MKYIATSLLALASSTAAFAPAQNKVVRSSSLAASALDDLPGSTPPIKSFDPVGYSKVGSDETLAWFRASELKHGRVAMVATTGYLIQAAGLHFPGMLSSDISFESLAGMSPPDQWAAVPDVGMYLLYTTQKKEIALGKNHVECVNVGV
jgi:Chlorophyll A-B binding protein